MYGLLLQAPATGLSRQSFVARGLPQVGIDDHVVVNAVAIGRQRLVGR